MLLHVEHEGMEPFGLLLTVAPVLTQTYSVDYLNSLVFLFVSRALSIVNFKFQYRLSLWLTHTFRNYSLLQLGICMGTHLFIWYLLRRLLAMGLMECNTDWKAIQQRFLPCKSKHQVISFLDLALQILHRTFFVAPKA